MSLPILDYKSDIIEKLIGNQVLIVTGEPGCGKSTKIPQFCVDSKELSKKLKTNKIKVAVTQPRRVAAIAMAKRVAYERSCKLGTEVIYNQVGYCIRFEDYTSSKTLIKYMTDGVLLRESLSEDFNSYSIIILDEAHERSLDTDILLALLKSYLPKNKYFRLIITSATIDIQLFSSYFNNCPVITIPGRQYPIEILHSACKLDKRVEYTVNAAIRIHLHEGPGDVLAFLTGSDECERAKSKCFEALQLLEAQGNPVPSMLILSLYGAMSSEEQAKVFKKTPEDCRKVVFSTNISETSITIDGIGYVIDCGYVKQKQFNPKTSLEALMIVPISKQQSHQRAGRAGRTQTGKCFRLYSENFYEEQMPENSQAEIFRSNLASVILSLKILRVDLFTFEFLQSPDKDSIQHAIKQLYYISAIDDCGNLTTLGKQISKFPLDPCFARSLISSIATNCSEEMASVI